MHLKRLASPKIYPVERKKGKFVIRGRGPHSLKYGIPLLIVLRDVLKLCDNSKEAKKVIKSGEIKVDGKIRRDEKFNVGFMDLIEIPAMKKSYRVFPGKKHLLFKEVKNNGKKICKITGIRNIKGGKYQITFHDGKNIISDEKYNVGDSAILKIPDLKIEEIIEMKENVNAVIMKGNHMGRIGKIKEIKGNLVTLKSNSHEFSTIKEYLCAVKDLKEFVGDSNE